MTSFINNITTIPNKMYKHYKKNCKTYGIACISMTLIFSIIIYKYIVPYYKKLVIKNNIDTIDDPIVETDIEGFINPKQITIMLFFADWCPHCTSAKPEWVKMIKQYSDTAPSEGNKEEFLKKYFGSENTSSESVQYTFQTVDCSDKDAIGTESKKLQKQYDIKGYPTIIATNNDDVVNFEGAVKSEGLIKWIESLTLSN
jgi:thiol-disulfide isomerase/thioredoxin